MVLVVEFKDILAADGGGHFKMFLFVAEDILRSRLTTTFFIVRCANEVAGITFADELSAKTGGITRNIVEVSVNCGKDLASVRLPRLIRFHDHFTHTGASCQ